VAKWQGSAKKSSEDQEMLKTKAKTQNQHPPNTLNASSPPLAMNSSNIVIYHISSLIHLISESSTNFVPILSPFGNELIKHESREERDAIHGNQN
jgi:hypothetical protein